MGKWNSEKQVEGNKIATTNLVQGCRVNPTENAATQIREILEAIIPKGDCLHLRSEERCRSEDFSCNSYVFGSKKPQD